jgi:hypothetical protein
MLYDQFIWRQEAENTAVGNRHADHVAPSIQKLALSSPTSCGLSVGIVPSRSQTKEFSLLLATAHGLPISCGDDGEACI